MLDLFFGLTPVALPQGPLMIAQASMDMENVSSQSYPSAAAAYEAGLAFHQNDVLFEATAAYEAAIALDPTFVDPYVNLSLIYIGVGLLAEAESLLQQVLTLPDHPEEPASIHALAHYNLGVIASRRGEEANALAQVNQALAIAPNFQQAQDFYQQLQTAP
ncbi:tetratricopeptide repeat protein [Synechococcus moorigangaii CMS01]|nr:tetratricopeptide repeat protein [Synechococcus moorigangaii CMS01]